MTTTQIFDKSLINIRKVELADVSLLVDYRLAYLAELQGDMNPDYREKLRSDLSDYFEKTIRNRQFFAFLAEINGKAVSFGGMVIKEIPGDVNRSTYLEGDILNMYTIQEARRKGISSLILENLLAEAKRIGMTKVALHTSKDGEELYRKFLFKDPAYPYLERIIE